MLPQVIRWGNDSACRAYFERVAVNPRRLAWVEAHISMAARWQVTNKLKVQYRKAAKVGQEQDFGSVGGHYAAPTVLQ